MLNALFTKLFGSRNDRVVKKMDRIVDQVNAFEETLKALSDEQLKAKTGQFRQRISEGETLDDLLPEAFATIREASVRSLAPTTVAGYGVRDGSVKSAGVSNAGPFPYPVATTKSVKVRSSGINQSEYAPTSAVPIKKSYGKTLRFSKLKSCATLKNPSLRTNRQAST